VVPDSSTESESDSDMDFRPPYKKAKADYSLRRMQGRNTLSDEAEYTSLTNSQAVYRRASRWLKFPRINI
jgi:hypothetical protein